MFVVRRSEHNPLLAPLENVPWDSFASFNWCPAQDKNDVHVVYRAVGEEVPFGENRMRLSTIGYAHSKNGVHFKDRRQLIAPEADWEKYGCEDPRITNIGGKYMIFYTALSNYPFNADGIRVAVAITKDFKKIDERHLVTPFNAKAMAMFPKKINGKYAALLTPNTDRPPSEIAYREFDTLEDVWNETKWNEWYRDLSEHALPLRRNNDDQVELGAPPVETKDGWLVIYSHIEGYRSGNATFAIEALLLDKKNPRKILGRTHGPLFIPETMYELYGRVGNIVFPSGARIYKKQIKIYYGAADTSCCRASIDLELLLSHLKGDSKKLQAKRYAKNPILKPRKGVAWEEKGVFNPGAIFLANRFHILYRAVGNDEVSRLGYADSKDGFRFTPLSEPAYVPREGFEKRDGGGGSGCEDPRLVQIGSRIYMTYTAWDGGVPKVAVSSIAVTDFTKKRFKWDSPNLITPGSIVEKDSCILPKKIKGKYLVLHRTGNTICADYVRSLNFKKEKLTKCIEIMKPRRGMWDSEKIGIAGPPIETKHGWVLLYHGVSGDKVYRVGAALLDHTNPTTVIARTALPLLEPEADYEKTGVVGNVVFPCGSVLNKGMLFVYYGGADYVTAVATIPMDKLLTILTA